jgi:hypothetical protein
MTDRVQATLAHWTDFYLITGTAAATLTGLQFIVQTLLASGAHRALGDHDPESGIGAFGTPTVVHFTLALVFSAVMCAWWPSYTALRGTLGALGVGALAYSVIVVRRARQQRSYVPIAEDWVWYILLPAVAYIAVVLAAVFLAHGAEGDSSRSRRRRCSWSASEFITRGIR